MAFAEFWARYPNHSSKKDAEKAWHQIVTSTNIEQEISTALDWQIPHWETLEWYHPPYAATYLRQERFRDERPRQTSLIETLPPWQRRAIQGHPRRIE